MLLSRDAQRSSLSSPPGCSASRGRCRIGSTAHISSSTPPDAAAARAVPDPAALINGTDDDVVLPETAHRYAAYLGPQAEAIMLKGEDHRLNSEAALARITQAIGEISTKVGFVPQPPVANDPGTGPTRKPVVDATPRPRR